MSHVEGLYYNIRFDLCNSLIFNVGRRKKLGNEFLHYHFFYVLTYHSE